MEIMDFVEQILRLREREVEQKVWEFWLVKYPQMTSDDYISYEEMLATVKQQEVKQEVVTNGVYVDQACF